LNEFSTAICSFSNLKDFNSFKRLRDSFADFSIAADLDGKLSPSLCLKIDKIFKFKKISQ